MNIRENLIFCALLTLAILINLTHCRSQPYFGPNDRSIRNPAQTQLRVESTLDIFLFEILPSKARAVLKNVTKNCAKSLTPFVDNCYKDYELESRYTLKVKGDDEELKIGCCGIWKYDKCVNDALESITASHDNACTVFDAVAAQAALDKTGTNPKMSLMCSEYSQDSFYCNCSFITTSYALTLIILLGLSAVVVAALLAGFVFYLSTMKIKFIYMGKNGKVKFSKVGYDNYGAELIEQNNENGFEPEKDKLDNV